MPTPTEGSDCVTGKRQYATRRAADSAASGLRHDKGWYTYSFVCSWCGCYHIGNRRAWNSKGRRRNIRR
jgi:hypothetical protein